LNYARPGDERAGVLGTLGWAVYLASSWTWCIGMFLPVLLVRDYGLLGWVVFALPNVIGAAAMGWVLKTPGQSAALAAAHRPALAAFSFVTAAFQIFFALWFFRRVGVNGAEHFTRASLALAMLAFCYPIAPFRRRTGPVLAAAAYIVSLACIVAAFATGEMSDGVRLLTSLQHPSTIDLLPLTPVIVFGFLLCPYLDRTFHHARQHLPRAAEGKAGFGVGFGVLFFTMIVFTLLYAMPVYFALTNRAMGRSALMGWVACHMTVQLAFTIGVHWSGNGDPTPVTDDDEAPAARGGAFVRMFLFALGTAAVGYAAYFATWGLIRDDELLFELGEVVYRCFMAFYGLVFPAYAWICMVPSWRDPSKPSRRALTVFAIAVAVVAPMYYVAFIEGRMIWLVPGLLVVLLARLAGSGSNRLRDRSPSRPPA
jgi:hypothetical protein